MKVMFYCQHVLVISYLVRSAEIARALSQGDDVTFVSGGVLPQASLRASSRHSLSTGVLVIGRNSELDAMLSTVLGMDGRSSPWKHSSNAVLHFPATSRTPVVQALNMPVWKEAFEPLTTEARP